MNIKLIESKYTHHLTRYVSACDTRNVDMAGDMRRVQLTFELDIKLTMSVSKMLPGRIQGMETLSGGGTSDMSELSRELVN